MTRGARQRMLSALALRPNPFFPNYRPRKTRAMENVQ
jgi:hypothetical protein